ncbi:class C beta-lactamase-related serine hydrolase [Rhodobacteraceae bacterium CCMM004]|nr:class C beta-lactamase-related serine hydrolase [Rhodobacteraceae bacterium CCMM004]
MCGKEQPMRLAAKIGLASIVVIFLAGAGGYFWLRNSPAWTGVTLFAEDVRVENFRAMDKVFPSRAVPSGGPVWDFAVAERPLPETYLFEGAARPLAGFLDETVTTGLLVVHDGTVVHEEYRLGASAESPFTSFSLVKSVLSALIGIAIEEGHIGSVGDPIVRYVPSLAGSGYDGVTIEDALTMSSGVDFDENYANPFSDIYGVFFDLAAGQSMEETLAAFGRARDPGTYNDYISADSIALGLVLEAATGMPNDAYLATRLWQPMGAEAPASWNTGASGPVLSFCCFNARLRDYARLGRLYLEGGARDGTQIVPRDWVETSTRPTAPHLEPGPNPASFWTFGYGYHWWIPEEPQDDFLAIGIWGQYVYVDRRNGVVIVKTSADPGFDARDHETVAAFRAIARHVAEGAA